MNTLPIIILVSLTIGVLCTYLLWRHDRQPYLERETYQALSVISFIFNLTGSFLCMYLLSAGS